MIKLGESAREFARYLDKVLQDETGPVIIDFEEINYIDSTGLGELVGYLQKFEERRRPLVLVKPSHRIRALLELTRLGQIFEIFETEEEAVEHLLA